MDHQQRSERIKEGIERTPHRALLFATGFPKSELSKPFVGIASSFTDLIPGHIGMRDLERFAEKGVHAAGGYPFIFGVPGICDGIAMGHKGMHYSLPSRELIADIIECVAEAHALDGLILLTNCDKITPGMLMAAARLNIPSIVITAGPMLSGRYEGRRLSLVKDTFEAMGRYKKGEITLSELQMLEECACPGVGACQGLYTANTMACLTEAMGMSIEGCATSLAASAKKRRIAYESGMRIVELIKGNITPKNILKREAFENAIMVDLALGGSTNSVLHLCAIAHEAGIDLPLELFDELSRRTPHIAKLAPAGEHLLEDLDYAGGIGAVLNRLMPLLRDNITVSGKTILEIAKTSRVYDESVIRKLDNPYSFEGGLAVLRGTLAPDGAVVKQSGVSPSAMKMRGMARVFDSEEEAMEAILGGRIKKGDAIVIRYEGPKGGPGMREMLAPTSAIVGMGMGEELMLITDGRFSGGTHGPCIGHVSPEAMEGGPIALVEEGDEIVLDIHERKLDLIVSDDELRRRRQRWRPPEAKVKKGYLLRYSQFVSSAHKGAICSPEFKK